ncbi:MAG: ATP-binding protein [Planctomycetota bacterium]
MRERVLLALAVCLACLAGTTLATLEAIDAAELKHRLAFDRAAENVNHKVELALQRKSDLVRSISGFVSASESITDDEWSLFTFQIRLRQTFSNVDALLYIEPGGDIHAISNEPDSDPRWSGTVRFRVPQFDTLLPTRTDLAQHPTYRDALVRSVVERKAITVTHAEDEQLVEGEVVIVTPVDLPLASTGDDLGGSTAHDGWCAILVRLDRLTAFAVDGQPEGIHANVSINGLGIGAPSIGQVMCPPGACPEGGHEHARVTAVESHEYRVLNMPVRVDTWSDGASFRPDYALATFIAAAGSLASVLIALLGFTLLDVRAAAERIAAQMTQQLTHAMNDAELASRSKSMFLANMSHEIRTPMTAIHGFTEVLLDPDSDESVKHNAALTIQRSGSHLLTLVNDILDLSKIEAGQIHLEVQNERLDHLLLDLRDMFLPKAHEKGIDLRVRFRTPVPSSIETDGVRLRQALVNLLNNAIKFTPRGEVKLVVWYDATRRRLAFDVVDTGIGIPPDRLDSLFEPFVQADDSTTRRFGGTGLGLSITHQIARLLNGDVMVESEPGRGSTFTLAVEAPPNPGAPFVSGLGFLARASESKTVEVEPVIGGRVLLVEDGPDNQRLITHFLTKSGTDVTLAHNGQEGVDLFIEARERGEPFDVVLMDMQMPVKDGYAATSELRAHGFQTPIIALTAHAMSSDRQKCLDAGCSDYLTKPINRKLLIERVALGIEKSRVLRSAHAA